MAKNFTPRVAKKDREIRTFDDSIFKTSDERLYRGARLAEIKLKDIIILSQVRTKFSEKGLKELAENIKSNGLIEPLVVHREERNYTLICGERRFRAMNMIPLENAPCYVLENKTKEELMAIQFSENSSREELHWIDKANGILNYQLATQASERKIMDALGISKSEVHRGLQIGKLPDSIKEAAKTYDIEKYVLLEWEALEEGEQKKIIEEKILQGKIIKRHELKKNISNVSPGLGQGQGLGLT